MNPATPHACATGESDALAAAGARARPAARRWHALALGFGAAVFAVSVGHIAATFQWCDLGRVLRHVRPGCLAAGSAVIMVFWALRTLRWHLLLRRTATRVPLAELYLCSAVSLSLALVTPFQSGEMLKIELLRKHGYFPRATGYGSFLVERVLDSASLLAIAGVSTLLTLNILPDRAYAYAGLGLLAAACVAALFVLARIRAGGRLRQLLVTMRQCTGSMPMLLLCTAITCAAWAAVGWSWKVFLLGVGIDLPFLQVMAVMSLAGLIAVFSLIPGGLGVCEVGVAGLLVHLGVSPALAQAGALTVRAISLAALVLGCAHWGSWTLLRAWRRRAAGPDGESDAS